MEREVVLTNIKIISDKKGLPLYEIEKRANIAKGSLSKWRKCSPSFDKVAKVADVLDVSVDELLKKEE